MAKSVDMIDILHVQEIEGMSSSLLHDHIERLQDEKLALEARLEEVHDLLQEVCALDDIEEIEEMQSQVRRYLEENPLPTGSF